MKEHEIHAFVFFADLRGWGAFLRRCSHYPTEVYPLWRKWEELIEELEARDRWRVKIAGDGALCIVAVDPMEKEQMAARLLNEIWDFLSNCKKVIDNKPSPRPDGIRVAGVYGVIHRGRKDWFGDKINLCERMTRQWRGKSCLINESWKELISPINCRRNGFVFTYAGKDPDVQIEPIYEGDMKGNWSFIKRKRGA